MNALHQNQPAALDLAQQYMAPGPLGKFGNLQFTAEHGATPRVSRPGMLSRLGAWCTDLRFRCCASEDARIRHNYRREVFETSRCVGDLLGSLTAYWADEAGQRDAARQLAELASMSHGDLGNLWGGRSSLFLYMNALRPADIQALGVGPLSISAAREAILNEFEPGELREQADSVLKEVEMDLIRRIDQDAVRAARDYMGGGRRSPAPTPPRWCMTSGRVPGGTL